jgi:hypothetical protein
VAWELLHHNLVVVLRIGGLVALRSRFFTIQEHEFSIRQVRLLPQVPEAGMRHADAQALTQCLD